MAFPVIILNVELDLGKLEFYGDGMIVDEINDKALRRRDDLDRKLPPLDQWKLAQAKRVQDELTLEQKVSRKKRK